LARRNYFVLDSFALIGYLENERFAQEIENVLIQAKRGQVKLFLHFIHLGEIYYITLRERGQELADLVYLRIKSLPIELVERISEKLLLTSAALKASYPISYADSFAASLAIINDASLLTGDREFQVLEKKGVIKVKWLVS